MGMPAIRILGVDPGLRRTGWGVVIVTGNRLSFVACGSLAYPVEWKHASPEKIKALGISKVMTMTSTYDHRVIQGAESGSFLRRIEERSTEMLAHGRSLFERWLDTV